MIVSQVHWRRFFQPISALLLQHITFPPKAYTIKYAQFLLLILTIKVASSVSHEVSGGLALSRLMYLYIYFF